MSNLDDLKALTERVGNTLSLLTILHSALDSVVNSVVITDADGKIIWVNNAFSLVTGYSLKEAVGQKPSILKSGQHNESFYKDMWDTIKSGKTWHNRIHNKYKDGSIVDELMTITPVFTDGVITHFVAVKQVERHL